VFSAADPGGDPEWNPRGDAEPFGGAEITQHLFAGSIAIDRARVELVSGQIPRRRQALRLRSQRHDPGSVSAVAERHGAEGDVGDRGFGHSNRLASLSIAAP